MLLGIVNWERISGLELLLANNTSVGEVEVYLSMPLYHCFVLHCLSTSLTLILQWPTIFYSCYHWLQQRIQAYNSFHIKCEDWGVILEDYCVQHFVGHKKRLSRIWFLNKLYFFGTMHLSKGTQHHWHDIWYSALREHSSSWSSLSRQCKSGWHQGALLRVSSLCTCCSPSRRPCTSTCLGYLFQPLTPV